MLKKIFVILVSLFVCFNVFAALTSTLTNRLVMGNVKGFVYDMTFTSATSGSVVTGLNQLIFASLTTGGSDAHETYLNYSDGGSTRAYGTVYFNDLASGATGTLFVLGY